MNKFVQILQLVAWLIEQYAKDFPVNSKPIKTSPEQASESERDPLILRAVRWDGDELNMVFPPDAHVLRDIAGITFITSRRMSA